MNDDIKNAVRVSAVAGYESGYRDGATRMRQACVEQVRAAQRKCEQTPVTSEHYEYDQVAAWILCEVAEKLESLTLASVEKGEKDG